MLVADKFCQLLGAGQATLRFMVDIIIFGIVANGAQTRLPGQFHMDIVSST